MIKIMICEDLKEVREGFRYLLNLDDQIKVLGAYESAEKLMAGIREIGPPHIVLMDIVLPGISGIEATSILKEKYPDINILMLTIFEEEKKILSAIKAGATGYILKNTKPGDLVNQIKTMYTGGSPISPNVARTLLEEIQREKKHPEGEYKLTHREKEIITAIIDGLTYKEIALQYNIAHGTVKKHVLHIYKKLNVSSQIEFFKKVININLS